MRYDEWNMLNGNSHLIKQKSFERKFETGLDHKSWFSQPQSQPTIYDTTHER